MAQRRIILILIATFAIVGGSYVWSFIKQARSTSAPASVTVDLENPAPARGMKTTDELITFWRSRFERDPRDFISLTFLGEAFIRKARETGDVSEYQRADATLRKALELHPDYEVAQAYLSTVQYVKHDFQGALDLATRVYSAHPGAIQSLATIADAQLELGNYAEAETAYQKLLDKSPGPPVYSRLARLAWLRGRPTEALERMRQAADESLAVDRRGESVAWYQFQLAELYFNTGQTDEAAKYYMVALDSFDNYYLALAGLGKARAAQGRYDEAIAFYERAVAIVPQPEFLAALGDLYTISGQPEKARHQYDTVEFIGKLAAINQVIYNRQLALFYDNHDRKVTEALEFSTKELTIRKDVYGYDAQAWSLYKNSRYQEAAAAIDQAMKLGTRDAVLYYHAGMISKALGDDQQARKMLSEALSINPHFDLLQSRTARATLDKIASN